MNNKQEQINKVKRLNVFLNKRDKLESAIYSLNVIIDKTIINGIEIGNNSFETDIKKELIQVALKGYTKELQNINKEIDSQLALL